MPNDDAYINISPADSSCVKILTWNIEGLQKYTDDVELKKYLQTFDIISMVET